MADSKVNAIQTLYKSLLELISNTTIKYLYKGEEYETLDSLMEADQYLAAVEKEDTFLTYNDFTDEEYAAVGFIDEDIINEVKTTGITQSIPNEYRQPLLELRRQRVIDEYVEPNNYYRCLNGYPDAEDEDNNIYLFYTPESIATSYNIDKTIPIHKLQDYYNALDGTGNYVVSILEGLGVIDACKEEAENRIQERIRIYQVDENDYEKEKKRYLYLNYIGSTRIDLVTARKAENFQIIQVLEGSVSYRIYSAFLDIYESCREYFIATIYMPQFRTFIDYYDNFIALCIMVMTVQQIIMRQIPFALRRSFFDIYSIKALYEMYDMPYNLRLDADLQDRIAQNLNLLIQNKATDKVIFDIAAVLGLENNLDVYKYYLSKQRKMDDWNVPIVQYTTKFNSDTGEVETVPDYEAMFDVYFQKTNLKNRDFSTTFTVGSNREEYDALTSADPYWHEDEKVFERVWETEYNFVESKYLGLGISYRLTDLMFKNVILLKLLMNYEEYSGALLFTLPRITGGTLEVPVFDAIIALICLMAAKHNLTGEIITIPTQVISILDFMQNVDGGEEFLVDTLGVKLEYFDLSVEENVKNFNEVYNLIKKSCGEEEAERFMGYINSIANNTVLLSTDMRTEAINAVYEDINALYTLLNWLMTKTHDRKTYVAIRTMYKAAFYSKEVKDIFTIHGTETGFPRTAWNFFEYLYYRNPKLYKALFKVDFDAQYREYIKEHALTPAQYPFSRFMSDYENGEVMVYFDTINAASVDDESAKDEFIYFNANHIISRLSVFIKNLDYMPLLGDMASVLEDMLEKLVRFFKSYTVELISFDTTIICDMKMENIMRLFDEIAFIQKTMHISDSMHLSYADQLHKIIANYDISDVQRFYDWVKYTATIRIDNLYDWVTNKLPFHDEVHKISKTMVINDTPAMQLFDMIHNISSAMTIKDRPGLRLHDEIRIYWSDELDHTVM